MGDLVMTSYKRADPQDEIDPRVSLILDAQSHTQSQPVNGHSCQNGAISAKKNKVCLNQEMRFVKKRTRCCILAAVILTVVILSVVTIILVVCLKSPEEKESATPPSLFQAQNKTIWTTTTTSTMSTTIRTETTSKNIPIIINYVTYASPGDSRIFQIEEVGNVIIRTYGAKSSSGRLLSLNHISVSDGKGSDTHIRLGTRNNMASVMLPDSTHVSYVISQDMRNLEMGIFTSDIALDSKQPSAFVQAVSIDSDVSILTKLLYILSNEMVITKKPVSLLSNLDNTCVPFLPLRVTKCGSQYPYERAFIEGKVRMGETPPVLMAALPWPKEPNDCFVQYSNSSSKPNYYIPFPVRHGNTGDFCESLVEFIYSVCTNRDIYYPNLFNLTCYNLALKTSSAQDGNNAIFKSVFNSCTAIFNSIQSMCSYLQYSAGISMPSWKLSKTNLSSLCSSASESQESQHTSANTDIRVGLHMLAFCPSLAPFRSPEQIINIKFNQSNSVGSPIHINCDGSPEITYMSVGHAYTGSGSLDRIMHRFKVCSICAFETSVRAVLTEDTICCNNTCLDNRVCSNGRIPAIEESAFRRHSSVYCHDFLADRGYSTNPLERKCLGNCDTKLSLDFTMFDVSSKRTFYHQNVACHATKSTSCKVEFGR